MLTFVVKKRSLKGKSASRKLRFQDKFPAVIYGGGETPINIEIHQNIIFTIKDENKLRNESIILVIDNEKIKVKLQAIQQHPFKHKLMHIDFIRN